MYMTDDATADATPSTTSRMSVYRMVPSAEPRTCLADKVREDPETFEVLDVAVGPAEGVLAWGISRNDDIEWLSTIRSLTGHRLEFTNVTASAALIIRLDGDVFALAFGHGWQYLSKHKIDREFGLHTAVRLLNPDDIKKITRWALSAKARVDHNMVPAGQGLWAFGLREHAEIIRQLEGAAKLDCGLDLTYVRLRGHHRDFRLGIECKDGIRLPLAAEAHSLIEDLRKLRRALRDVPVDARLEALQWVRRVPKSDELCATLDSAVGDLLMGPERTDGEVGIAYPARYYEGPDVQRYVGKVGAVAIDTDELTIEDLRQGLRGRSPDEFLTTLRTSRIRGRDDSGADLGEDVSALNWMAAEIVDPQQRYVLLDGDWYELRDRYVDHVSKVVTAAFANEPSWKLPAWREAPVDDRGRIVEGEYNKHVAQTDNTFLCLDKKLLRTKSHPHGFEVCDLLGPNNELIHVKKFSSKTGSSVLSHLFAQGLVAIESLIDHETWQRFVDELVKPADPERAKTLGARPTGLTFAMHRPDKELTPDTLFTFARSALVTASTALTAYHIPLQIAKIP